ncbi:hypothetical protein GGI15_004696 [Coemansia interrupta]|uniref:Uncharacterized protein n=1 Tax=Coemansia interrupta TaxID=1126814 RepID=A0A9W8H2I8_9FUNG|nr:hypothetical protein GGI15_004696 [Coemansia interrupta]
MKTSFAATAILAASLAAAAPAGYSTTPVAGYSTTPVAGYSTTPVAEYSTTSQESHDLRTFTNDMGYTLLYDLGNPYYAGFEAGIVGVDGIYNVDGLDYGTETGTDTWVDVNDGYRFEIDKSNPSYIVVYDPSGNPVATQTEEQNTYESMPPTATFEASHYLMTLVNQDGETLLVDAAQDHAAILQGWSTGVDGVYTVGTESIPPIGSETDTWVDTADGIVVIVDEANPNAYTVYDESSNPILTYDRLHPTPAPSDTNKREVEHQMHTFTNADGDTVLIDMGVPNVGVYIEGSDGVDGIYSGIPAVSPGQSHELDTWADGEGIEAVIDYADPYLYTVFESGSPVTTVQLPTPTYNPDQSAEEHHLRTFTNGHSDTVLVDYAVSDMAVVQDGIDGVDGIYNAYESHSDAKTSGTDTWYNDYDSIKAVIDYANPSVYTVYDYSDNPVATIGI